MVVDRDRLTILRDHLASLPDDSVDMMEPSPCGTASCIGGWANRLFNPHNPLASLHDAQAALSLSERQFWALFYANNQSEPLTLLTRAHAIAAIDSMIENISDHALPVWPA